jgi:hypothetical protein
MMRLIIFIVVVLPQPDGPTSTTISPSRMSIVSASTAVRWVPGKRFVSSSSRIMTRGSSPAVGPVACRG